MTTPLVEYLLRLGDDRLVLGHRLSEWCGHGPILEEDIALANIALDLIGQATMLLKLAGEIEARGRDEDALAFFREAIDFRNTLLVELPKGDFGVTIVRQFLFSVFAYLQMDALQASTNPTLAGIAAKAVKEARYHVRHSGEWLITLGDGTAESRERVQNALDDLWRYTGELFLTDDVDRAVSADGTGVDPATLQARWREQVTDVIGRATLTVPASGYMQRGGRSGRHTEHLGHMLAEMQIVARSNPGGDVVSRTLLTRDEIFDLLDEVKDPEVPVLSVVELGIVRDVRIADDDVDGVTVVITPTYSGCPAMRAIERDIARALEEHGVAPVHLEVVYAPAWTTDWLTDAAKRKLEAYGIAPPSPRDDRAELVPIGRRPAPRCPHCGSTNTSVASEFGSTACKSIARCHACDQPFEQFKAI